MSTPQIELNGRPIANAWSGDPNEGLVALDRIEIPWGRSLITDRIQGHVATVELIDTTPINRRRSPAVLMGQRLQIKRTKTTGDTTILLDGIISDVNATVVKAHDDFGREHEIIKLAVSVSDSVAVMSRLRLGGRYTGLQLYGTGGQPVNKVAGPWSHGGWATQFASARLTDLAFLGNAWLKNYRLPRDGFVSPSHPRAVAATKPIRPAQTGVKSGDLVPMWELVEGVFAAAEGLGWPRLQPGHVVEQGRPQTAAPIRLVVGTSANSKMAISSADQIIDASNLIVSDPDAFPLSQQSARVASVSITIARHVFRWQPKLVDSRTGETVREDQLLDDDASETIIVPVENAQDATQDIQLPARSSANVVIPPSTEEAAARAEEAASAWNAALAVAIEAAQRAGALNGWATLPELVYRPTVSETEIDGLLQPWDSDAMHLNGSMWHALPNVPRTVQFIGGTLTWSDSKGWESTLTAAPTIDTHPRDLTIAALFGNLPNTFATADSITLAQLPAISERTAT